jgi:tetratricopeptide (TPR) repeat protein
MTGLIKKRSSEEPAIKLLYEKSFYILKIILIWILLIVIIFLVIFVIWPEKGIVIQPFESIEGDLSGAFIANQISFELQNIYEINDKEIRNLQDQSRSGMLPPISLQANTLEYNIIGLGNIGVEGTTISIGHLILSLKQFIGSSTPMLTGSVQASKSDLRIIALLKDPDISERIIAWKIKKNLSNNNYTLDENMDIIVEDLAFQIVATIINKNKDLNLEEFPRSWVALKYYTMSRKAYIDYDTTGNINYLDNSRDYAFKTKQSEPFYSKLYILLSILGSSYYDLNRYPEAQQLFENATELDSSYTDAWNGLGLALFRQGNYIDSIRAYDRAIELDNEYVYAWYNKGIALYELGELNESIMAYDQAIELNSTDADAWFNKGLSLLNNGMYPESIKAFNEVLDLSPGDEQAWNNKGVALFSLGNYPESIQAYDEAIRLNSSHKGAHNNKGLSLAMEEKYNESILSFDEAIKIDQNYTDAWRNKGVALELLGRLEEANESFSMANNLEQSA